MKLHNNMSKTMLAAMLSLALSACGGGGGEAPASSNTGGTPVQNQAPTLSVTPSSLEIESGQSTSLNVFANDDGGSPTVSVSTASAGLKADISIDGKTLNITANDVQNTENGSVVVTATEQNAAKQQVSKTVNVVVHPKVDAYAYVNESEKLSSLTVSYNKPLRFRLVTDGNAAHTATSVSSKDPSLFGATMDGQYIVLTALKSGNSSVSISGISNSGNKFVKTLSVQSVGNQQPTLVIAPSALTLQETTSTRLPVVITDPDSSALQNGQLSVRSSDASIATVSLHDGGMVINALKSGTATLTATLVDGEFTVTSTVMLSVTPEAPPVLTINQNNTIEIEEESSAPIPLTLTGSKTDGYTLSAKIEAVTGSLNDIEYTVTNNTLNLTAKALPRPLSVDRMSYRVTAVATNGKMTVTSFPVIIDVMVKTNGVPVFELSDKFGRHVMLPRDGRSVVTITVNDDRPDNVEVSDPLDMYNNSKAGTYSVSYDKVTRQLSFNLTGFEKNEEFALFIPYKDGRMSGRFAVYFRTYELTDVDRAVLETRKVAIATTEAARAYQLIGKMYAEHLENTGIVDEQFVDEFVDQLQVDDLKWNYYSNAEGDIQLALTAVYRDDFNTQRSDAAATQSALLESARQSHMLGRNFINDINALAKKSNGVLPELNFENTFSEVSPLRFSKFVGNSFYGEFKNGVWSYRPEYKFLAAIDAKVFENTAARLK